MIYWVVVLALLNILTGFLLVISENRVKLADREVRLRDLQIAEALSMRDDYRDRILRLRTAVRETRDIRAIEAACLVDDGPAVLPYPGPIVRYR